MSEMSAHGGSFFNKLFNIVTGFACLFLLAVGTNHAVNYFFSDAALLTRKFAIISIGPIAFVALFCAGMHYLSAVLPAKFNSLMAPLNQKVRDFLWPVHGIEHLKFIPLTLMVSCILFNFTVLRTMKDTLVVTTCGSELITFLKVWAVLPSAVLFFLIFTKLSNMFSKSTVFYSIISFFIGFFILFAAVLYPYQEYFHPLQTADAIIAQLPAGLANIVNMFKYWSFSLFYIMAELWGSVVSALLFWQFANSIVKVSEAKRFYGHFYLLANIATAFSGDAARYFSAIGKASGLDDIAAYGITLNYMIAMIVTVAVIVMALYYFTTKYVMTNPRLFDPAEIKPKKKKPKLSMGESIKFILNSRYLLLIALLVVSYGVTINLVEVAWKSQLKLQFPAKNDYQAYVGDFYFYMGVATFLTILLGGQLLRWLGWLAGALATPILIGLTGGLFFICMIFNQHMDSVISLMGMEVLAFTVFMGTIQNILSKSTKYALFDPTKEMSYIPLDDESKGKGKAAVDVVGGRLGKAGGAFIQQMMFIFIGPVSVIAPYSAIIMMIFVVIWIFAAIDLNRLFKEKGGDKL